jgi:osmotically-inducible protein OsmY
LPADRQTYDQTEDVPASHSRVRLQVARRLHDAGYLALREIHCSFESESGHLHLRGRLPSYYLRQVALAVVADIEGVGTIIDQIRIHSQATVASLVHGLGAAAVPGE